MFYEPRNGHGLPHNPFNALITPRPIGWISTRGTDGSENLAPYSFFNGVSYAPPQVMFASTASKADREWGKDSVGNIIDTGVFCVNVVGFKMRDAMNATSAPAPRDVDEFDLAGLAREDCATIACSRVAAAPASMECKLVKVVDLPGEANIVVFGEVTGIHLRDEYLTDGIFDVTKFQPLARLGYRDYARVTELFSLQRPAAWGQRDLIGTDFEMQKSSDNFSPRARNSSIDLSRGCSECRQCGLRSQHSRSTVNGGFGPMALL